MNFDLTGESSGEWFAFFRSEIKENGDVNYLDPEEGAGKVCLRIADPETIENIQSQTRKAMVEFVLNPKQRAMERVKFYDQTPAQEKLERRMIWDHAIKAWEGILDKDGDEIPCTIENKLKLMNIPVFARFVGRCLQLITGANAQQEEAVGKN
jgi:hypothetical protein